MARYDPPSHHLRCPQSRPTTDFLQGSWPFVEIILGVGRDWKQCEYQCVMTWMCFQSAITLASIYTADWWHNTIAHHRSIPSHGGLSARYDRPSHHSRCPQSRPTIDFLQGSWSFVEIILGVGRDWKQCEYQYVVTWMCFQSAITLASIYTADWWHNTNVHHTTRSALNLALQQFFCRGVGHSWKQFGRRARLEAMWISMRSDLNVLPIRHHSKNWAA